MSVIVHPTRSPATPAQRPVVDWEAFRNERVDSSSVRVVRTTCLLESRSSAYGDYLQRALPDRFASDVTRWADEEHRHGRALRRWLKLADPTFDFDDAFERFSQLPYHDGDLLPSRGGAAEELLARCVVEAFASGYYDALGDYTHEPLLKQICSRLKADERRHLDLFALMLSGEQPLLPRRTQLRVVARRVLELTDDQIVFAAHCANGTGHYNRRAVRRVHFSQMLAMHRPRHLGYISNLIAGVVNARPPSWSEPA